MIATNYDDPKRHIHVLSYGGGTQSTALLIMSLKGEINGVIPDYVIFSDTGWEGERTYSWVHKVNEYIKKKFGKEIMITNNGSIRLDILNNSRFGSLPFFTKNQNGKIGMLRRQMHL